MASKGKKWMNIALSLPTIIKWGKKLIDLFKKKKLSTSDQMTTDQITHDIETIYEKCKDDIVPSIKPLFLSVRSGNRTLVEVMAPMRAHFGVVVEHLGDLKYQMANVGDREKIVAGVIAKLIHDAGGSDFISEKLLYWIIQGLVALWRANREVKKIGAVAGV